MTSQAATQLNCSQCGGELHPDEGQVFLTCPYCAATVYLDKSRVVFHWYVAPTLNEQQALAALYRWMSGSQTVKDLDKKARVTSQTFQYFPIWYFKTQATSVREDILLQPAAATSITELAHLNVPAGDLRKYDPALDSQAVEPTVPLDTGLDWARRSLTLPSGGALNEASLVHVPLYFFKYVFRDQTYTAVVDAASGTVWANLFPAKQESPYIVVGVVIALVYLCLALVPLVTWATGDETSAGIGLAICGGVGAVAAPLLFAWAFYVASRV